MTVQALNKVSAETAARPWLVVAGSALALTVCNGPIILFTFGVLIGPITAEFGWPRATLASAVVAAHATGALVMPFIGGLIDRFGVRAITLPAIGLFALTLAGIGLLPGVPVDFIAAYALLGLVGAGHSTLPYARAVSTWFDEKRGLALGLTLAGVGLGTASMPQIARLLVSTYGWRGAYIGLAAVLLAVAAPAVLFLVRDRRDAVSERRDGRAPVVRGLTWREAVRTSQFWSIGLALFFVAGAVNGSIAHVVPLLADRGVSMQTATAALSATGFALILGRILSGYCLDRFFAPYVSAAFFVVPLFGIGMLSAGAEGIVAVIAAVLLGIGIGAEVDIMAFLTGRYFGLAHYGAIYGLLLALFTLGSGVGPWLIALMFDHYHGYTGALTAAGVGLAVASALVVRLGPYRYT